MKYNAFDLYITVDDTTFLQLHIPPHATPADITSSVEPLKVLAQDFRQLSKFPFSAYSNNSASGLVAGELINRMTMECEICASAFFSYMKISLENSFLMIILVPCFLSTVSHTSPFFLFVSFCFSTSSHLQIKGITTVKSPL